MANAANNDRKALLSILARLDQLDAAAETMLAQVADTELVAWLANMRGLLGELNLNVIEQLALLAAE